MIRKRITGSIPVTPAYGSVAKMVKATVKNCFANLCGILIIPIVLITYLNSITYMEVNSMMSANLCTLTTQPVKLSFNNISYERTSFERNRD